MDKFFKSALASLFFLACLVLIYWAWMRWGRVNVVFYSAIGCAVAATAVAAVPVLRARAFTGFTALEKTQLLAIWLLLGYAFAISIPTVIDRSLSFYLLEKLQQRGGGIREDAFADVFTQEYLVEHRLVDVRDTPEHLIAEGVPEALVRHIARIVMRTQFKRRPPMIAKLSARTVGWEFRYPRDWGT